MNFRSIALLILSSFCLVGCDDFWGVPFWPTFIAGAVIGIVLMIWVNVRHAASSKEKKSLSKDDLIKDDDILKPITKSEVEEKLGNVDRMIDYGTLFQDMYYMGGLDDDVRHYRNCKIRIKGLEIIFSSARYGLLSGNIKYWSVENTRVGSKSKSIVGRALVGGLIFGKVGAVVGGLTGIGNKNIYSGDIENIITFCYNEGEKERVVLFNCRDKYVKRIYESLKESTFGDKFKNPSEFISDKEEPQKSSTQLSVADELKKLKELLDDGLLTKEEFYKQKEKLLD